MKMLLIKSLEDGMNRIYLSVAVLSLFVTKVFAGNGDLTVTGNMTAASVSAPVITSRGTITTNEASTYGNIQISGNKGGYFGILSSDYGRIFMFNAAASGIYKDSGAWAWYFDDAGVLQIGTVPGAKVSGTVANATTAGGLAVHALRNNEANKIVRTNASGYIDSGYINTVADTTGTAASHFAYQSNSDNYLRWMTKVNARNDLGVTKNYIDTLGIFAGNSELLDGYHASSFALNASPVLTGTPTAPTAPTNTRTTQIATTAFANPGASLAGNGYVKLPSGVIMQWGQVITTGNPTNVTFPIPFTTTNYFVTFQTILTTTYYQETGVGNLTVNGFSSWHDLSGLTKRWYAIGY